MLYGKLERYDEQFVNHIAIVILSVLTMYFVWEYIRPMDWLSTSQFFDRQGFNMVVSGVKDYRGQTVSEESFYINLVMWLGTFLMVYCSYVSGPFLSVSFSVWWKGPIESKIEWFNWWTLWLTFMAIVLSVMDSHFDFLYKTQGVEQFNPFWGYVISYGFYGMFSEWIFGISFKLGLTSFGILLGLIGVYNVLGIEAWAKRVGFYHGAASEDSRSNRRSGSGSGKRKKKTPAAEKRGNGRGGSPQGHGRLSPASMGGRVSSASQSGFPEQVMRDRRSEADRQDLLIGSRDDMFNIDSPF